MRCIRVFAVLAGLLLTGGPTAAAGRVALVVGNGEYDGTAGLANTVNDASAVAEALEALDFKVTLATELDRRKAIGALDRFSRDLAGADLALFYYAGHGIQIGGQNFLLPVDVDVSSERALRYSAIDIQEIVAEMERNASVAVVVLDACRDNPFLETLSRSMGGSRSLQVSRGLGPIDLKGRGAIIAYAASAGAVASDGSGEHSPYTQALLEEVGSRGVELGLMFRRVAGRVIEATRGVQRPELLVRLVDEVYLNPAPALEQAVAGAAPEPDSGQASAQATGQAATPAPEKPEEPVEVAQAESGDGQAATRSTRFFGNRAVREPPWAADPNPPKPFSWRPAEPGSVPETDANNSFGTAQPIAEQADLEARISPRGDEDWYRFEVPVAGELQVLVENSPPELDLYARVWNADRGVTADWQGAGRNGGVLDARFPLPGPGSYRLQLSDGRGDADSTQPFTAQVRFVPAYDELEPNNSMSQARPVPLPFTFEPTIFPRGDHDWYRLWIPAPGLLTAIATRVPEALDVYMRLWNLDGKVVRDWIGPPRKGGETYFQAELAVPDVYLLEVADGRDDEATTDPIAFSVEFLPVPDEAEPNNSFGEAALRKPSGEYRSAIFPRGDTDWIAFDIEHPGQLDIVATGLPKEIDLHVRAWNANKDVIHDWIKPFREGGDLEGFVDLPRPGRYFLEFADGRSDASSEQLFDLALDFRPQLDQYEPNNSTAEATPLTPGGEIAFNILPKGDTDWFRIDAPSAGELAATIDEGPDNLDLHFRVWNADRKVIRDWVAPYRKGGLTEGYADLPGPGVYYLELSDGRGDDRSIDHAILKTVFSATADPLEPNNSYGAAKPVAVGTTRQAHILPKGDTDWYLLEAPRAGEFSVVVDQVDEALDIFVRLWDSEGRVVKDWIGPPRPGGVTDARLPVKASGQYRLEIADGRGDSRSPVPFRVSIGFE